MFTFALIAIAMAILLAASYQFIGSLLGPREKEQSLVDMESEMIALDAACARALEGSCEEAPIIEEAPILNHAEVPAL